MSEADEWRLRLCEEVYGVPMTRARIRLHCGGGLWWAVVTWPDGYRATTWLNTCVRAVINQSNLWLRE
jgi:hypothetical protein